MDRVVVVTSNRLTVLLIAFVVVGVVEGLYMYRGQKTRKRHSTKFPPCPNEKRPNGACVVSGNISKHNNHLASSTIACWF